MSDNPIDFQPSDEKTKAQNLETLSLETPTAETSNSECAAGASTGENGFEVCAHGDLGGK